jgi:hypothetical protein
MDIVHYPYDSFGHNKGWKYRGLQEPWLFSDDFASPLSPRAEKSSGPVRNNAKVIHAFN